MSGTGRHASTQMLFPTRLSVTASVAVAVALTAIITGVATHSAGTAPASSAPIAQANAVPALSVLGHAPDAPPRVAGPAHRATMPLVLTAADRRDCPAAATACVDLSRHITWLQRNGKTSFGPVRMEPGKPGGGHETPRGTFRVEWKAGPSYVSNIYHEPMPWATFFASGGIAFHGGSLTAWSHGCVHLSDQNAHYYNRHLPIGSQVVVF